MSTRPVSQKLAGVPVDPAARDRRRRQVVAGAYPLRRAAAGPLVTIAAMGAVVPEAMAAADRLSELGVPADVVVVAGRACCSGRCGPGRGLESGRDTWILDQAFPRPGPRRW